MSKIFFLDTNIIRHLEDFNNFFDENLYDEDGFTFSDITLLELLNIENNETGKYEFNEFYKLLDELEKLSGFEYVVGSDLEKFREAYLQKNVDRFYIDMRRKFLKLMVVELSHLMYAVFIFPYIIMHAKKFLTFEEFEEYSKKIFFSINHLLRKMVQKDFKNKIIIKDYLNKHIIKKVILIINNKYNNFISNIIEVESKYDFVRALNSFIKSLRYSSAKVFTPKEVLYTDLLIMIPFTNYKGKFDNEFYKKNISFDDLIFPELGEALFEIYLNKLGLSIDTVKDNSLNKNLQINNFYDFFIAREFLNVKKRGANNNEEIIFVTNDNKHILLKYAKRVSDNSFVKKIKNDNEI